MPSNRRRLLGAAAGALATGLAGCGLLSGSASSSRGGPPDGDPVTDYETARHVVDGERQLFHWTGDDRSADQLFVATPDERSAVEFDGNGPVATFVADTDLRQRSLALFQKRHEACRRLDVVDVRRRSDEVSLRLCRETRPADDACSLDASRSTALAVRLPFDGRDLPGGLSVVSSTGCFDPYGPYRGES
jgi:hypothetical protein